MKDMYDINARPRLSRSLGHIYVKGCDETILGFYVEDFFPQRYRPDKAELAVWSRKVELHNTLSKFVAYRVREDYYKVFEGWVPEDEDCIAVGGNTYTHEPRPPIRLVGTDVVLDYVSEDGEYGFTYDVNRQETIKIYKKYLRVRAETEEYVSCGHYGHGVGRFLEVSPGRKRKLVERPFRVTYRWCYGPSYIKFAEVVRAHEFLSNTIHDYSKPQQAVFRSLHFVLKALGKLTPTELEFAYWTFTRGVASGFKYLTSRGVKYVTAREMERRVWRKAEHERLDKKRVYKKRLF